MVSMAATSHGPMTRAERDALPDDGRRHELIDGVLVVTPVPPTWHQFAVANLFRCLDAERPADVLVLLGPLDVALADDTVLQPDHAEPGRRDAVVPATRPRTTKLTPGRQSFIVQA